MDENFLRSFEWYTASAVKKRDKEICQTRDIFQARLDRLFKDYLKKIGDESSVALLSSIIGELGNNCFDHNLGQWRDIPGCWMDHGVREKLIWGVIADRGQGVLSSLKNVLPPLQTDQEAIETAFEKRISGRSPEQRGNGLKFVRNIINGRNDRGLIFFSGRGVIKLGGLSPSLIHSIWSESKKQFGTGTLALIFWGTKA
jgi:hypothetical protein